MARVEFVVEKASCDMAIAMALAAVSPTSLAAFLSFDAHDYVLDRVESRFSHEGDDAVGPWAPLAYPTQQIRRAMGLGDQHPINVRTGEFLNWLRSAAPEVRVTNTSSRYTYPGLEPSDPQTAAKFKTSQKGSKKPSTPARPAIGANETDLSFITLRLENWVRHHMGGYST